MERITATYYIETPYAPEKAAAVLAGEQSSGTFVAVPAETEELKQRFAARVENIELLKTVDQPAMPGAASEDEKYPGVLKILDTTCR
jgi:ribulose-bisphosphate carboxylase large chain